MAPEVRVNAIAPGLVDSKWLREGLGQERFDSYVASYKSRAALAEVLYPEDCAKACWFLGVDAVKTTGEVLLVDAGLKITKA